MENKTLSEIVDMMVEDIKAMTASIEARNARFRALCDDIQDYIDSQDM